MKFFGFDRINLMRKGVLSVYRVFSLVTLYSILFCILAYAGALLFYSASTSWIVPFMVTKSDISVLAIGGQLATSTQAVNALQLDYDKTVKTLIEAKAQEKSLGALNRQIDRTITAQKKVWAGPTVELKDYETQKKTNNAVLTQDTLTGKDLRRIIQKDLAEGIITKADAETELLQLDSFDNAATDSKIATTLLNDSVRQHQMVDISGLDVLAQKAQLEVLISQVRVVVETAEEELSLDRASIKVIDEVVKTATGSPFYSVIDAAKPVSLAIVPYNLDTPRLPQGAQVFDCFFGMVICRKAGTIKAVYTNEQLFEHPILHINMRGYIVAIDVDDDAAKSKTLIVGRKPFLF
jgi:hypothetical protein